MSFFFFFFLNAEKKKSDEDAKKVKTDREVRGIAAEESGLLFEIRKKMRKFIKKPMEIFTIIISEINMDD